MWKSTKIINACNREQAILPRVVFTATKLCTDQALTLIWASTTSQFCERNKSCEVALFNSNWIALSSHEGPVDLIIS